MSILKNVLIKTSGNRFIQNLLERNVQASQYLMGIGAGSGVLSSGELAIFSPAACTAELSPICQQDSSKTRNFPQPIQTFSPSAHHSTTLCPFADIRVTKSMLKMKTLDNLQVSRSAVGPNDRTLSRLNY